MSDSDDAPREATPGWGEWNPDTRTLRGQPAGHIDGAEVVQQTILDVVKERDSARADLGDAEEANKQLRADLAAAKRQNRALRNLIAELVAVTDDLPAKGGTPVPVAPPWGDDTRGMGE